MPDTAQTDSQFGLAVDVGDAVKSKIKVGEVVWFNPHQLSGSVSDNRGLVDIYSIDEEAVLAVMDKLMAEEVFGAQFSCLPDHISFLFPEAVVAENKELAEIESLEDGS